MPQVMPRMRGTEATKKIRDLGYVGVILGVTGNVLDDDVREFKAQGADEVLPKPFEPKQFIEALCNCRRMVK